MQIEPDVFFPLSIQPLLAPLTMDDKHHPSVLDNTELWWVQLMARAKPGVSAATAGAAMTTWLDQDEGDDEGGEGQGESGGGFDRRQSGHRRCGPQCKGGLMQTRCDCGNGGTCALRNQSQLIQSR